MYKSVRFICSQPLMLFAQLLTLGCQGLRREQCLTPENGCLLVDLYMCALMQ